MPREKRNEAQYLAERLSDAICGWLTFQQAARRSRAYNEHLTYLPIFEVADGRGWRVFPQFAVREELARPGAPNTVDFLFFHKTHKVFVALEIKFQKSPRARTGAFTPDVLKLVRLHHGLIAAEIPRLKKYCTPAFPITRVLMTIGQRDGLRWLWNLSREDSRLRGQAMGLWKEAHPKKESNQTDGDDGLIRISPTRVPRDFRILTLFEQKWWAASRTVKRKKK